MRRRSCYELEYFHQLFTSTSSLLVGCESTYTDTCSTQTNPAASFTYIADIRPLRTFKAGLVVSHRPDGALLRCWYREFDFIIRSPIFHRGIKALTTMSAFASGGATNLSALMVGECRIILGRIALVHESLQGAQRC